MWDLVSVIRRIRHICFVVLGWSLVMHPSSASGEETRATTRDVEQPRSTSLEQERYINDLIRKASDLKLAKETQWIRLGHWTKSRILRQTISQADGLDFFIHQDGKESPQKELEATITAFFTAKADTKEHPICRFPARFLWLAEQLKFDASRLTMPTCKKFQEYLTQLDPKSITLVFSSYFLSKAASAFGHTFIRVDKQSDETTPQERRKLLDTGVDFSAEVTTSSSLAYMFMGFTGGFAGHFGRMPYYFKVRQYNDFEARDLWEYRLNLNPKQLRMLIFHLWELGSTYFEYFYLSENCSYHILALIETADPSLELLKHVKYPVIPADTVKVLNDAPGLVNDVQYRPSLNTQFQARLKHLSSEQQSSVLRLMKNAKAAFPADFSAQEKIDVLDATQDYNDLRFPDDVLRDPKSAAALRKQALLERRALIREPSRILDIPTPWHKMPQSGHGTRRINLGYAHDEDLGRLFTFDFRLTMHDLADAPKGYPELSSLEFFRFLGRFSFDQRAAYLEEFSLVKITHLVPFSSFSKGMSWKIDFGGTRVTEDGCQNCLVAQGRFAGGLTKTFFDERVAFYTMVDTKLLTGPGLRGIEGSHIRLGIGSASGFRLRLRDSLIALTLGDVFWQPGQHTPITWDIRQTLRWEWMSDLALDASVSLKNQATNGQFSLLFYY